MVQELEYWMAEMSNRAQSTKAKYAKNLEMFCQWLGKTPEQILEERKQDLMKADIREQRRYETQLKLFMAYLQKEKQYSIASQQVAWASIKSFFETNYLPLVTRKGDYPSGESLGHRPFLKSELKQLTEMKLSLRTKSLIFFLKDSGLRIGDVARLTYGDLKKGLESQDKIIPIKIQTQKAKTIAKTFIGEETTELLRKYIALRRKGTRRMPAENVTDSSPLFRQTKNMNFPSRSGMSSLIGHMIIKAGLDSNELSAHSFRKYFQTQLEASGVPFNWVQLMMGHKLIGVEGSYSKPTDEQLKDSYIKAYDNLRIYPRVATAQEIQSLQKELESTKEENKQLRELIAQLQKDQDKVLSFMDETKTMYQRLQNNTVVESLEPNIRSELIDKLSEQILKEVKKKLRYNQ
jgi:site-specific recombinase XerD